MPFAYFPPAEYERLGTVLQRRMEDLAEKMAADPAAVTDHQVILLASYPGAIETAKKAGVHIANRGKPITDIFDDILGPRSKAPKGKPTA